MPLYDFRCEACGFEWEENIGLNDHAKECDNCGSNFTKKVWLTAPSTPRTKDTYDYLDGYRPPGKPIKSFANDRRKGGKDTT